MLERLRQKLSPFAAPLILVTTFLFHVVSSLRWMARNPLPNGYQNEILHLGNALDLYVALAFKNYQVAHGFVFKGYWPPLHYLTSMVPVGIFGPSRESFIAINFVFLALLLAAVYAIGKRLYGQSVGVAAAVLLSFFPSIYGNLVRFEPNVPLTALVACGFWLLLKTHEFRRGSYAMLFGLVSGMGMLVDRLSYMFFLWLPAIQSFIGAFRGPGAARRRMNTTRHAIWSVVGLLVVAGYYYSFFFALHSDEIFSQATAGEIIETGEQTEIRDPRALLTWLFYPLTFIDAQGGFALGLFLVIPLILGGWISWKHRSRALLLGWGLGSLLFFTLVQKKQIFYTIPTLPVAALLASAGFFHYFRGLPRLVGLLLALFLMFNQHQGLLFANSFMPQQVQYNGQYYNLSWLNGQSPLPERWVYPRYPQARPPDDIDLKLPEIYDTIETLRGGLPVFRIGTFSEDRHLFNGYLTFFTRAANPYLRVNGMVGNVQAFYEWAKSMDLFIYATDKPTRLWPVAHEVDLLLEGFHRDDARYPAGDLMAELEEKFTLRQSLFLESGTHIHFYTPRVYVEDTLPAPGDDLDGVEITPTPESGSP